MSGKSEASIDVVNHVDSITQVVSQHLSCIMNMEQNVEDEMKAEQTMQNEHSGPCQRCHQASNIERSPCHQDEVSFKVPDRKHSKVFLSSHV